jgi:hypothetical protein
VGTSPPHEYCASSLPFKKSWLATKELEKAANPKRIAFFVQVSGVAKYGLRMQMALKHSDGNKVSKGTSQTAFSEVLAWLCAVLVMRRELFLE